MVKVVITSTLRKYVCKQSRVGTNKPISRYRFKAEYQCICNMLFKIATKIFLENALVFFHSDFTSYINHCVRHISWCLSHWGQVTHTCVSKLTIIGSNNGLSPGRRQAIIWTNAGILLIRPIETNFSEILLKIHTFSLKKSYLKMSFGNCRHLVSASMCYWGNYPSTFLSVSSRCKSRAL